jgi:large subunit ribosomal protein L17
MRHHKVNRKFGRKADERKALMRSLALSLVTREKIKTTDAKARELRPFVEKLITRSKVGTVATRRFLVTQVGLPGAKKLIETIGPKFKERSGGYTRIVKLPARVSDGSLMAYIELV